MQDESDLPALPKVPMGRGRDRRASLVIKETKQLLNGLHEDADRSEALMAELEALLAAAQHASGEVLPDPNVAPLLQFAVVQPMQVDDSTEEICEAEEPVAGPRTPMSQTQSEKRRSSIVTFDGSSLIGNPGGPLAPGAAGSGTNAQSNRANSFTRPRAASLQAARSFSDSRSSNTIRRSAVTEVGSSIGTQSQLQQPGGSTSVLATGVTVVRRSSIADTSDSVSSSRKPGGALYGSPTSISHGQVSVGSAGWRDELVDDGTEGPGLGSGGAPAGGGSGSAVGQGGGGGGGGSGGGGGPGGGGAGATTSRLTGSGGGRIFKIIRGIFHSNSSADKPDTKPSSPTAMTSTTAAAAAPTSPVTSTNTSTVMSTTTTTTTTTCSSAMWPSSSSSLGGALAHGALSSMAIRTPSRSQVARGSMGGNSFTANIDLRRASGNVASSVGGGCGGASGGGGGGSVQRPSGQMGTAMAAAPQTLLVGRTASSSGPQSPQSPHALVPTSQSSRQLWREMSISGVMQTGSGMSSPLASPIASANMPYNNMALYGTTSPSTLECRLVGTIPSRRSLNLPMQPVSIRGQL